MPWTTTLSGSRPGWAQPVIAFDLGDSVVPVLPGADQFTIVDIVRQTYGYASMAPGVAVPGVKGLNALLAIASAPVQAR